MENLLYRELGLGIKFFKFSDYLVENFFCEKFKRLKNLL